VLEHPRLEAGPEGVPEHPRGAHPPPGCKAHPAMLSSTKASRKIKME